MNSEKEQDRLTSLKIIEKRYSFLFEDLWFILLQYMYFEKFIVVNTQYSAQKAGKYDLDDLFDMLDGDGHLAHSELSSGEYVIIFMKYFGFMTFNLVFTALVGLGGLPTIPHCLKMAKKGKTKTKIFYIMTFIQILLQITLPFMRAGIVILQGLFGESNNFRQCVLVGFQVYSLRLNLLGTNSS